PKINGRGGRCRGNHVADLGHGREVDDVVAGPEPPPRSGLEGQGKVAFRNESDAIDFPHLAVVCRGDDQATVDVRREGRHAHSRSSTNPWDDDWLAGGRDIGPRSKRGGLSARQSCSFPDATDAQLAKPQDGKPWCDLPVEGTAELGKV